MSRKNRNRPSREESALARVYWILESGGLAGGVKVILEYANRLSQIGFHVGVLSLDQQPKWFQVNNDINWHTFSDYETLAANAKSVRPDVVIGTWWKTAYAAQAVVEEAGARGFYFVQDIET